MTYEVGTKVKVTITGVVRRHYGDSILVEHEGNSRWVCPTADNVTVEVIEPPVEVFGPGSVVRSRAIPEFVYTVLGNDRYFSHNLKVVETISDYLFTSDKYERLA